MPYVALQQMLDEGVPWGIRAYTKGLYLDELPDPAIDLLAEQPAASPLRPFRRSCIFPFGGGAIADVGDDDTAFGGSRSLRYVVALECIAPDPETFAHDRQWVRDTWNALRPAAVHDGAYVNLMAEFEGDSLRNTYGPAKFDRLRRDQGAVRPDERVPAQRQHPARLRCDAVTNGRILLRVLRPEAPSAYPSSSRRASSVESAKEET